MKAAIIIVDTEGYKAKTESAAAAVLKRMLEQVSFEVKFLQVLPEDVNVLAAVMERLADAGRMDLILTLGSTGVKMTDCVPEATAKVVERMIPGIAEAMRAYNLRYSKKAMLDRSVAGTRGNSLIVNLPDTAKSAKEGLEFILPELVQTIEMLGQ